MSNTDGHPDVLLRRLNVLLRRPNGCNLEQFEASRHRRGVRTENSHRPDG
jgi:hypothetical protein